ncbi:S1 RNA-binding domain-containing protein [bacterium]|nr:S1 RNA-binding domain-containing protein [bacterium]
MVSHENENYAKLLEESFNNTTEPKMGDVVEGEIINITETSIFINMNGKYDAYADITDYKDKNGKMKYQVGDLLRGFIVEFNNDGIKVSKSLRKQFADKTQIRNAFEEKIPVEGKVFKIVNGGYSVDVLGVRAFCPKSQMDIMLEEDSHYLNNNFTFLVTEYEDNGRNIIVSRKRLLHDEAKIMKEEALENLEAGKVVTGVIRRLTDFGAFVDLGGIEGLLHVSEIAWAHINKPSDVLTVGTEIEVKILAINGEKISLSMKALQDNPLDIAMNELETGTIVECRVLRLHNFGAFVEIIPGVEGLIPISEMAWGKNIRHPKEVLREGDVVSAQIFKLDKNEKKINLSLKALLENPWDNIEEKVKLGELITGTVENNTNFGAFVTITDGITGLLPRSRMPMDMTLNSGDEIELRVTSIDTDSKRISLELKDHPAPESLPQQDDRRPSFKGKPRKGGKPAEWKKWAQETPEVPEDNPFNQL